MKNYMLAALAAVPCVVAVAPAASVEDYVAAIDEQMNYMKDLMNVLAGVKDKETADAAAASIKTTITTMKAKLAEKEKTLGEPTPEQAAELEKIFESRKAEFENTMRSFMPLLMTIAANEFYGSEALKDALSEMDGDVVEDDMDDEEEGEEGEE